uniref:Uncharacterized protein n=1 Tax=Anguilla anguilla TaxID=7936 RepID=A0A0E9T0W0_ANGAN
MVTKVGKVATTLTFLSTVFLFVVFM